jgi:hypothetical protein
MTEVTPSDMEEHRGFTSPRSAYSRIASTALLRETLLSNTAVANVDTRLRTIEG